MPNIFIGLKHSFTNAGQKYSLFPPLSEYEIRSLTNLTRGLNQKPLIFHPQDINIGLHPQVLSGICDDLVHLRDTIIGCLLPLSMLTPNGKAVNITI